MADLYKASQGESKQEIQTNPHWVFINGVAIAYSDSNDAPLVSDDTPVNAIHLRIRSNGDIVAWDGADWNIVGHDSILADANAYTDSKSVSDRAYTDSVSVDDRAYTDTQVAAVPTAFRGSLSIADSAPTLDGVYFFSQSGTYANFGSVAVDLTQGLVYGTKLGTTYKSTIIPIALSNYMTKPSISTNGSGFDSSYTLASTSESTRILGLPFGVVGNMTKLTVRASRSGPVDFYTFTRSGNVFTIKASFTLVLAAGLNTFSASVLPANVLATDYLGWYVAAGTSYGFVAYKNSTANTFVYSGSGAGSGVTYTALTTLDFGIQAEITTTNTDLDNINASIKSSSDSDKLFISNNYMSKPFTVAIGTAFDASYSGVSTVDVSTRILGSPLGVAGDVTKITIRSGRSGSLPCGIYSRAGNTFTLVSTFNLSLVTSLNVFTLSLPTNIHADYYFGWFVNNPASSAAIGFKISTANTFSFGGGSGLATGVVFTPQTGVDFGVVVESSTKNTDYQAVNSSIAAVQEQLPYIKNDGLDVSTFVTTSTSKATRLMLDPILIDGYIRNIKTNFTRGGYIKFKVFSKNGDGTYNLIREKEVRAELGVNTLELNIQVSKGNYIGWYHGSDAFIGFTSTTSSWGALDSIDATGNNITFVTTTVVNFGLTFDVIPLKFGTLVKDTPESPTARTSLQSIGVINNSTFYSTTLPSGWVNSTGFLPTTTGLQSPASGSWATVTYWDHLVVLDEDYTQAKIIVNDASSIFALVRASSQSAGTAIEINGSNNTMNLYTILTSIGATPSSIVKTVTIPSLVIGREYHLRIKKQGFLYIFSWYDTITQNETFLRFSRSGNGVSDIGNGWNGPGLVFRQGNVKMIEMLYSSTLPRSPKIVMFGDSIMEGLTILSLAGGGYNNRWASLVSSLANNNCSVMARAGETSTNLNAKLSDINSWFKAPEYAIYAIGINDTTFSTWKANFDSFKAIMDAKGTETILITLFPRTGNEAFNTQVTNYVLTSGIRYIDFAKAMTVNGDRVTRDDTLFIADHLHPTPAGHLKMFNQVKIDVPDLFY